MEIEDTANVNVANDATNTAGPYAINGYYPLYADETISNAASPSGSSHIHKFYGQVFYMPDGLVMNKTMFHGNYTGDSITLDSSSSSSSSSSSGSTYSSGGGGSSSGGGGGSGGGGY